MSPEILLGAVVVVPIVAIVLLRINAALVFMSLCLGDVLVQFVAPNTGTYVNDLAQHGVNASSFSSTTVSLTLLLLPAILTAIFMIRTVKGRPRLLLNVLPAVGVGLLAALLAVPLMSAGLSHNITDSSLWTQVQHFQDSIVAASAVVCMIVLWMQRPKAGGEDKHGKHHKG